MADGRGGYRQPRDPAPVSGPGRLSRRTDGGPQQTTQPMTGMGYGENAEFNAMQGGAPLAATPSVSNARARSTSPTGQGGAAAVPLFSPTGFPEEPVTAGANFGPGEMGSEEGMFAQSLGRDFETMKQYLPDLEAAANFRNTPASFRFLVSYLRNL
jgi:hypothetical protein